MCVWGGGGGGGGAGTKRDYDRHLQSLYYAQDHILMSPHLASGHIPATSPSKTSSVHT